MLPNSDGEMNADTAIQYVAALGKQLTVQFSLCLAPVGRGTSSFMNQRLIEICSAIPPILSSQWQMCDFLNRLSRLTEAWGSSLPLGLASTLCTAQRPLAARLRECAQAVQHGTSGSQGVMLQKPSNATQLPNRSKPRQAENTFYIKAHRLSDPAILPFVYGASPSIEPEQRLSNSFLPFYFSLWIASLYRRITMAVFQLV